LRRGMILTGPISPEGGRGWKSFSKRSHDAAPAV